MSRQTLITVDLNALRHNLEVARSYTRQANIIAVIKANAYGHGAIEAARALKDADMFAVATLDEAIALRLAGIEKGILLLEGFHEPSDLHEIASLALDIVLHCPAQLDALLACNLPSPVNVWLKIDTGMHRLGLATGDMATAYKKLEQAPQVRKIRLMTHFANADNLESDFPLEQLQRYYSASNGFECEASLCNSAALVHYPQAHHEWVRPGIMLYGANPFCYPQFRSHPVTRQLRPVMTFHTRIIALRRVEEGESVGYGRRWTAPGERLIATLAVGYADGYPRHAPNGTPVLVHGKRAPLVGTVSMDLITIDVTEIEQVKINDKVILWGEGLPVEEIADHCGTINYALLTGISNRVTRQYLTVTD